MIVLATVYRIIDGFLVFVLYAILAWVILSWILAFSQRSSARWRYRQLFAVLDQIDYFLRIFLSPFMRVARKILPRRIMPREWSFIDLSPLVASVLIIIVRAILAWGFSRILFANVSGG